VPGLPVWPVPEDEDGERERLIAAVNARLAAGASRQPGHVPAGPRDGQVVSGDWVRASARRRR
jgi:hypothetical protein